MRFRIGLGIGFAAGYVLGSRAGRERYEQIARTSKRVWESERAEKLRHEVAEKLPDAVNAVTHKVGELRHRNGDREALMSAGALPA